MPAFSEQSLERLSTCAPDLWRLFGFVVERWDCTILEGHRDQEAQTEAFRTGRSQVEWPDGNHNTMPSRAVDVAPYPIDWQDLERFRAFGGFVLGVAAVLEIPIRWGGDWDGDRSFRDQRLVDMPHFELAIGSAP